MPTLSFISLNIERDKHLDLVLPFLEKVQADVVCLQELFDADIPAIEAICGPCFFTPMCKFQTPRGLLIEGLGIFSRLPMTATTVHTYLGKSDELFMYDGSNAEQKVATQRYVVALASVQMQGVEFRVATTHFPWATDGGTSEAQQEALPRLLAALETESEFILCGDFNAPRGRPVFTRLAEKWTDNIPTHYTTSIDGAIHRAGPLPHMVDGLFSTPKYFVSDIELQRGVSDHCAVVARIERK